MKERCLNFGAGYQARVYTCGNPLAQPLILLHGFMQKGKSWSEVANHLKDNFFLVMPDLPGHGATLLPQKSEAFSFETHSALVQALIDACALWQKSPEPASPTNGFLVPEPASPTNSPLASKPTVTAPTIAPAQKPILVGYSMGGRVAAMYACENPEAIQALVLESAGLGFKTEDECLARAKKNEKLFHRLLEEPFEQFIDFWEDLPLFDSQKNLPEQTRQAQRETRLANDPAQLAYSLLYAGQQAMPDLRKPLSALVKNKPAKLPILYMAGALDVTYTGIARSFLEEAGSSTSLCVEVIKGAGHNIHLEKPEAFCEALERFVTQGLL
jgi:2-succinyl-6-hydroxy-2,4-cyclohexadiene-1-carboxylate synthase